MSRVHFIYQPMVLVKLQGGLGNQMFQYAAAKGLSKTNNPVYTDHHFLESNNNDTPHFTARKYELQIFKNIKAEKATPSQLRLFKSPGIRHKLLRRIFRTAEIRQIQNEFISFTAVARGHANIYLDGYFQSEKYFNHCRQELMEEFEFPPLDLGNGQLKTRIKNAPNAVSIHIRRGDYLQSPIIYSVHGVLSPGYYQKALNILKSKYQHLSVFVFSDDIDWAAANLNLAGTDASFVTGNDSDNSWKDMALMSHCDHHIIANSSFSWWGAWLSKTQGDVFAPANWFNAANVHFDINDFIPGNWHIIQHD